MSWIKCTQSRPQLSGVTVAIRPKSKNKRPSLSFGISADLRDKLGLVGNARYDLFVGVDDHHGECLIVPNDDGLLKLLMPGAGVSYFETSSYPAGVFVDTLERSRAVANPAGALPSDGVVIFLPPAMMLPLTPKPGGVISVRRAEIGPESGLTSRTPAELEPPAGQAAPAPSEDIAPQQAHDDAPRAAPQAEAEAGPAEPETGKFWTVERHRELVKMRVAKVSYEEIAIHFDCTEKAAQAQFYIARKKPECADLFQSAEPKLADDFVPRPPAAGKPSAPPVGIKSVGQAYAALERAGYTVKQRGSFHRITNVGSFEGAAFIAKVNELVAG